MTDDDTSNVAAMVEDSLQLIDVIILLCPTDGSTSHQHLGLGIFRKFEMGELLIHRINPLWTVITLYIGIQMTLKLHTTGGIN